jgi:hypothetical protein
MRTMEKTKKNVVSLGRFVSCVASVSPVPKVAVKWWRSSIVPRWDLKPLLLSKPDDRQDNLQSEEEKPASNQTASR